MVSPLDLTLLARQRYADAEDLLVTWLTGAMANLGVQVSTEMPEGEELTAALANGVVYVQVEAFGGGDRSPNMDRVNVDIDVYAGGDPDGNPDRGVASDAAALIRAAMLFRLPGYDSGSAVVLNVSTFSLPAARPYDESPVVRRFSGAYQVTLQAHN